MYACGTQAVRKTNGNYEWALRKIGFRVCLASRLKNAHAGSRTRVTSMGGLYDTATLHALCH